ncbi:tRNA-intron lyase [Candidatus Heimdallarchaeota archaeon B3_Heim]|nr:MAG: tRNA-intron lyase [Candidatus Heimdallarchaeota archaeon B3_Heim]
MELGKLTIEPTAKDDMPPSLSFDMSMPQLVVEKPLASEIFENGYFGHWTSDNTLCLDPEEILLLLDRGRIVLKLSESDENIASEDLVIHFTNLNPNFWSRYLVYKDLRNRGYVVSIGTRITAPFRIYSRGGKPGESASKTVIYPIPEGEDVNLDLLDQIVKQAKIDRKKLLLSVIDRLGDVTYYQASQLELEYNNLEYEFRDEISPPNNSENGEE